MIRALHVCASPIVFIPFYGLEWQERVFKFMKNDHFLIFLSVFVLFSEILGRLMSGFY